MQTEDYKYKISYDIRGMIMSVIFMAIFIAVSIWAVTVKNIVFVATIPFSLIMAGINIYSVYSIMFRKILAGENGFTHQIGVGKTETYEYCEIPKAWITTRRGNGGTSIQYFNYETPQGKVNKYMFYPYQDDGIDYLMKKINGEEADINY